MQLEGIFDVPPSERSTLEWSVNFDLPETWNIGAIVGPSGCGKTTIARELFADNIVSGYEWNDKKSILDDFPKGMSIKDICDLLSSVGFSSPPSWVRPFHVLSNGEQFRVNMARMIAEQKDRKSVV
jgi:ABC-type glutathione transport system ATPase component